MEDISFKKVYQVILSQWEKSSPEHKKNCSELMKLDGKFTQEFCHTFFKKFSVLVELAHIIRRFLRVEKSMEDHGATEEYYACLFAVKYLQYRGDTKYLNQLSGWINHFLHSHSVDIPFDLEGLNQQYHSFIRNVRTHAALHFVCIREALVSPMLFTDFVPHFTDKKIQRINHSIIFQKHIDGEILLQECIHVVFGFHETCPLIEVMEKGNLRIAKGKRIIEKNLP